MKINLKLLFVCLFFTSCILANSSSANCNESRAFKRNFFYNISIVERHTLERKNGLLRTVNNKVFLKSLTFISKYVKVSMDEILNYEIGYPSIVAFEADKVIWVKWYEANKCKNLK